jgi:hypothetical protein
MLTPSHIPLSNSEAREISLANFQDILFGIEKVLITRLHAITLVKDPLVFWHNCLCPGAVSSE